MRGSRSPLHPALSSAAPLVQPLEPRVLYSADLAPLVLPAAAAGEQAWAATPLPAPSTVSANVHTSASTAAQASTRTLTEIVFLDATVPDARALQHDLEQQVRNGRALEVMVVRPDEDGLARIASTLAGRQDIGALHLIGHGQAGEMYLGRTVLNHDSLMARAGEIAQWRDALDAEADILLYGCEVGATARGRELVDGIAALTGADVAANETATGSAALGGDWTFEVRQGHVDHAIAFSQSVQSGWTGVLATAVPSGKGEAVWTDVGTGKPVASAWDGFTLGPSGSTAVSANWTVITSAQSATRDEAIVIGVDSNGVVRGQMWNGSTWTALPQNPLNTNAPDDRQSFAVAYEQQSGDAVLMWANGNRLYCSTWNGSAWSATVAYSLSTGPGPGPGPGQGPGQGVGTIERLQVAHKPGSDQMIVAFTDSDDDKYAMIWNGSQFGHAIVLDTSGDDSRDQLALAVAYESQSGTAMVAYGKHGDPNVYYRLFNGLSWSAPASAGNFGPAGSTLSIVLASDPNSDRLVMAQTILQSSGGTLYAAHGFGVWDGDSWGQRKTTTYAPFAANTGVTASAAFESVSGDILAVYQANDSNLRHLSWNQGMGWSNPVTGPAMGATPTSLRLFADPTSNHIMLGTTTSNRAASVTDWDGASWGGPQQLSANSGSIGTPTVAWFWRQQASRETTGPTLWLGPSATDPDGWTGVNGVHTRHVLALSDPDLSFGNGTTGGTFSHVFDASAWGANGLDDIAWVSRTVALNPSTTLLKGDLLFTTTAGSTLSSLNTVTVANNDIVLFRPQVEGDYSRGTFTVLFSNVGSGAGDIRGLALVDQDTVVGDVTLTAGSLLYTVGNGNGNAHDIYWFLPTYTLPVVGTLVTNYSLLLVNGSDLGIGKAITGLELVSSNTSIKNATLNAGQLLLTLADTSTVANTANVSAGDVVALTLTRTSMTWSAQGSSSILVRGSALSISGLDSLALYLPTSTHAPVITGDTAFTVPEFTTAPITTITASDADGDALTYSISGGSDQARFTIDASTGVLRFIAAPNAHTAGDANGDNIYQVTVRASDGVRFDDRDLLVQVQPLNWAPVNTLPLTVTTTEDTALWLSGLEVSDPDAGDEAIQVTLSVQHGTLTVLATISGGLQSADIVYAVDRRSVVLTGSQAAINATLQATDGVLYQADANYHGGDTLTLATDDLGHSGLPGATPSLSDVDAMAITVTAVNDAPVITSGGGGATAVVSIIEYSSAPVATITATDVEGSTLVYSIAGGADQAAFTIDAATGVLRLISAPDTDVASSYTVTVRVSDGELYDEQTLTVTVQPFNRAPVNTLPGSQTADEGTALAITGLAVRDPDAGDLPITVTLSVLHGTLTILPTVSGGLTAADITYASDRRSVVLTGSQTAINATLQAAEGVGYLGDADYAGSDTLTMVSNDQGHSGLEGSTPTRSDEDSMTLTVRPVTDLPTIVPGTVTAAEDQPVALDLQVLVGDTDNSGAQFERITEVTLSGLPAGATFTNTAGDLLTASDGVLTLTAGQWAGLTMHLPEHTHGSWELTVQATAQDGNADTASSQASWTVTVTPVNDAPVINSNGGGATAALTVPEFALTTLTTVSASDVDNDTLTYSIVGGADADAFTIDASTGALRFRAPPDTDVASVYTVVVRASDGSLHAEQTLTVTLLHLNRAPINTLPGTITADEDTRQPITGLAVVDRDAGAQAIKVTLQVMHGTLSIDGSVPGGLSASDITYSGDRRSVVLTGSQAAINATLQASEGVVYLADADYSGSDSLTMLSDDQGHAGQVPETTPRSDEDTVGITVRPVTDLPTLTLSPAQGQEDQPLALDLQALVGDTDNSGGQLERIVQITLSGIPPGARFSNAAGEVLGASEGVLALNRGQWTGLTMTPPPDAHGSWTLLVRATAQDGAAATTSAESAWTITVQAVDDAPVVSQHVLAIQQGGQATVVLQVKDVDTPADQITVQVLTVSHGHFELASTGQVIDQFNLSALQSGAVRFAHDGSEQAPVYALSLSDGTSTLDVSPVDVRFALSGPSGGSAPGTAAPDKPAQNTSEPTTDSPSKGTLSPTAAAAPAGMAPGVPQGEPAVPQPSPLDGLRQNEFNIVVANAAQFVLDLAPRDTPNYSSSAPITLDASYTWLGSLQASSEYSEDLRRNLENLQQQLMEQGQERRQVIASSIALSTGLSVGYVIWLVRGGALLGSVLSAMPAWAMIDPMPVLARARTADGQTAGDGTDASVEDLFDDHDRPTPPTPKPPSGHASGHDTSPEVRPS